MTRFEVIDLFKKLGTLDIRSGNKFFMFAIEKNKSVLKAVVTEIDEKQKSLIPAEYIAFENARMALLEAESKKDENGSPIIEDNKYRLIDSERFNTKMDELKKQYADGLTKISLADAEFSAYLKEDVSVEFSKVSFKFIPDIITADEFQTLRQFIKESDEEILAMGA